MGARTRPFALISPDAEELYIAVDNQKLGGWEEVHIVRGVERLPSAFYIRTTDRFPGQISSLAPKPGSTCKIYLTDDLILTGYVDVWDVRLTGTQHTILLSGRSKPEDLVDSSLNPNDFGGGALFEASTMGEAAKKIAKPFKIDVAGDAVDEKIPDPKRFPLNPGMTAGQLLEEIARTTGTLIWDDEEGRLIITKVGTGRSGSALVEGQNIESLHAVKRMDIRYSDYIVLGQDVKPDTAFRNVRADRRDPEVVALKRYRSRVIPLEAPDQFQKDYADRRADWEAGRRYGRANVITIGVTGWRDGRGDLWYPNNVVSIDSPSAKIKGDRVISEVTWERGPDRGTTATLTCMPREGLLPEPLIISPTAYYDAPKSR